MTRIAIVDDHDIIRDTLSTALRHRGYEVEGFPDGAAALMGLTSGEFDLVVSDVNMPRMDGLELCRALRVRFDKSELPIILLSAALATEDEILQAFELGANDFISKPVEIGVLLAKLSYFTAQIAARRPSTTRITVDPSIGVSIPDDSPDMAEITATLPLEDTGYQKCPCTFGTYILLEPLGRGGFGRVYKALTADKRTVAIKFLSPQMQENRTQLARFLREVAALASVESERLAQFLASGYEAGRYYLVMEYVAGETSSRRMKRDGPITAGLAARILLDIADALNVLHDRRLVHRDVKPANIMLRADGRATLVDMGLTKQIDDTSLTQSLEIVGTPNYLAPEIFGGAPETAHSDMYSLGATLYTLLTTKTVVPGRSPYEVMGNVLSGKVPIPLQVARPDLDTTVAEAVHALLSRDPSLRPGSASLLERLEPFAARMSGPQDDLDTDPGFKREG